MPSDDFWADLPSERHKKLTGKPKNSAPGEVPSAPGVASAAAAVPRRRMNWPALGLMVKIGLGLIFGVSLGLGLLLFQGLRIAADVQDTNPRIVSLDRGNSTFQIAENLESQGLLISRWPFFLYSLLAQRTLKAGVYSLTPSMTPRQMVDLLAAGATADREITIPEGWRLEQIADHLDQLKIVERADFLRATRYDPVRYTLPPGITREVGASLEGLLFPDTYRFSYGATSKEIVATMLENFVTKTAYLALSEADLILASIIEHETKVASDRAQIAGVYLNRLQQNIRLQADPTVQYGKDTLAAAEVAAGASFTWWQSITTDDYQAVKSPSNTYLISGLPPGPIANPGLASLEAAKNPVRHNYFYFLHRPDGTTVFSKTLDEHNRARQNL